jgi:hypothetical protein
VKRENGRRFNVFNASTLQRFNNSRFRFRFAQAGNPVAFFPLAALLEERRALETLEYVALAAQGGRRAEAAML